MTRPGQGPGFQGDFPVNVANLSRSHGARLQVGRDSESDNATWPGTRTGRDCATVPVTRRGQALGQALIDMPRPVTLAPGSQEKSGHTGTLAI